MKWSLIPAVMAGAAALLSSCSVAKETIAPAPMAGAVSAANPGDVEQELIKLDQEWSNVYSKSDPGNQAVLERILADEYMYVEHDGRITDKEQDLAFLKTLGPATESVATNTDYRVRVYGDTAVMTHRSVDTRKAGGNDQRTQTMALHVFVKRDGRWQLVAAQRTLLPQQQPR